jgi:hypothetical protein
MSVPLLAGVLAVLLRRKTVYHVVIAKGAERKSLEILAVNERAARAWVHARYAGWQVSRLSWEAR